MTDDVWEDLTPVTKEMEASAIQALKRIQGRSAACDVLVDRIGQIQTLIYAARLAVKDIQEDHLLDLGFLDKDLAKAGRVLDQITLKNRLDAQLRALGKEASGH